MSEEDIEEMFTYADNDGDGKISYTEFQIMINPPKHPEPPRPTLADLAKKTKMEDTKVSELKVKEPQPTTAAKQMEPKSTPATPATIIAEPLKGTKPGNDKGRKKDKDGKKKILTGK